MHMSRLSSVSPEQYLFFNVLMVKRAVSQLYVEPNKVNMYRTTFLRPGKSVPWGLFKPEGGRVSLPKTLFQSHISLEVNQFHLERPWICPLEQLLLRPSDICEEECILCEHSELLSKAETTEVLLKLTISFSTESEKVETSISL